MKADYRPDAVIGHTLVDVKRRTDTVNTVRMALMQLAYALSDRDSQSAGFLVLVDPKITPQRLLDEQRYAQRTLNPKVAGRLHVITYHNGEFHGLPHTFNPTDRGELLRLVEQVLEMGGTRIPSTRIYYELLRVLVHQWLRNNGPMTADWLATKTGCSYPTVAKALEQLGPAIKRLSDRRFELAYFPKDEWARLVAVSDRMRSTMRFADRSGQPRSPDSLLQRVQQFDRPDLAIGGVFCARHYYPDFDLIGSPRLDLTIHCPGHYADLTFVERLDPALEKTKDSREPAKLVLHFIRREDPLFEKRTNGLNWVDTAECLLDLHEMRLESEARDFLNSFPVARGKV
ncbi:MAG TPA: hypothetical protein VLZ30_05185 [Verrucomicrobiae bacterium]|nr:hypothetical protein [Verrucomicrobiae bacterium]